MADHVGWRNFWWLNVGLFALTLIMTVFGLPETKWHRVHPGELGHDLDPAVSTDPKFQEAPGGNEKAEASAQEALSGLEMIETSARDPSLGKGSPSRQQFNLFQRKDTHTSLLNEILTPWKLLAFPIVEFASFIVSWSASCFLTLNLTQAQNFAAPPYLYTSEVIGMFALDE
jgi:hypothetical protein